MRELVFSLNALEDLIAILEHVARDRPSAAVRLVDELERRCSLLLNNPELGMRRDDLANDLRLFVYRTYGIYYRDMPNRVRIERVLHGARNVGPEDFDEA
jgi:toxin ParE1/3/4